MTHALFAMLCIVWGSSFILMKLAKLSMGDLNVASYRVMGGAATLLFLWSLGRRRKLPFQWRDLGPLLLLSVVGYVFPFVVQPFVISRVDARGGSGSALAGMMISPVPILTILMSIPMLGIRPTARQVVGVLGGLACLLVLFGAELAQGVLVSDLMLAMITPAGYSVVNTYVKRRFNNTPPLPLVIAVLTISSIILFPLSLQFGYLHFNDRLPTAALAIAGLSVICTGLAYFVFYRLIISHGPLYAGMVSYIIPAVAVVIGALWGEPITASQVAALTGIFAMVALVQWPARVVKT